MLGLLDAGLSPKLVFAINKNPKNDAFLRKHAIKKIHSKDLENFNHENNVLLLAVKPKDINLAIDQLRLSGYRGIVCSLAAGIGLKKISSLLGSSLVVRAMPTTTAEFRLGTTAIYSDKPKAKKTKLIEKVFNLVGATLVLKVEKNMHDFTAIIGSGQAFIMQLLKEYETGLNNFSGKRNSKLIINSFLKSLSPQFEVYGFEKAIKKITSKKGTTEAGLARLNNFGVNKILKESFKSAKNRSKEIENEFK